MSKYNETNVTGESWIRANKLICTNEYEQSPSIFYQEEELFNFSDGKVVKSPYTPLNPAGTYFTPENANTTFEIINPETEQPTGQTAEYKDLYVLIHSLYFHLTKERDRGPKPYPSWIWNETSQSWEAPVPKPEEDWWVWNEGSQEWQDSRPTAPYPSWIWNNTINEWEAPVPKPEDGLEYIWNEETQAWDLIQG